VDRAESSAGARTKKKTTKKQIAFKVKNVVGSLESYRDRGSSFAQKAEPVKELWSLISRYITKGYEKKRKNKKKYNECLTIGQLS
jgi:hypothetical protein